MRPRTRYLYLYTLCGALLVFVLLLSACAEPPASIDVTEEPTAAVAEVAPPAVELAPPDVSVAVVEEQPQRGPTQGGGETVEEPTAVPTLDAAELEAVQAALTENLATFLDDTQNYNATTAREVQEALDAREFPFLVDVRCHSEVLAANSRYIAGAIVVPLQLLAYNVDRLPQDKDTPIVVYGKSDADAAIGAMVIALLGYPDVKSMQGGSFNDWLAEGYATETLIAAGPG